MGKRGFGRRGRLPHPRARTALLALVPSVLFLAAVALVLAEAARAQEPATLELAAFDLVWQTIDETYVDTTFAGVDWEGVRPGYRERVASAPNPEAAYAAIVEMVDLLQDEQTFVVPPADRASPEGAAAEQELEYAGIGVIIQQLETGNGLVVHVVDGSPAQSAGVLVGDVIVAVDGWSPGEGEGVQEISQHIRGPVDTPVELVLQDPEGGERVVTVIRGFIDLRPAVEHRVLEGGFAYLRLPMLTDELVDEGSRVLPGLLPASGMVLDLRGVAGGTLGGVIRAAQWFLGAVQMGSVFTRAGPFPLPFVPEAIAAYNRPLVVLVGRTTGELAEILALLLREYGRATLVGQQTQGGFAFTQSTELPGEGLLQVAVGLYVSPLGRVLPSEGLTPAQELPPPELAALREGRDPHLERALEVLQARTGSGGAMWGFWEVGPGRLPLRGGRTRLREELWGVDASG